MRTKTLAYQLCILCISSERLFLPPGWSELGPQVGLGNSHPGSRFPWGLLGCSASSTEHVFPVFLPPLA